MTLPIRPCPTRTNTFFPTEWTRLPSLIREMSPMAIRRAFPSRKPTTSAPTGAPPSEKISHASPMVTARPVALMSSPVISTIFP